MKSIRKKLLPFIAAQLILINALALLSFGTAAAATPREIVSQEAVACSLDRDSANRAACYYGYTYTAYHASDSATTYCSQVAGYKKGSTPYTWCTFGSAKALAALGMSSVQLSQCGKYLKYYTPGEQYSDVRGMAECMSRATASAPKKKPTTPTTKPGKTTTKPKSKPKKTTTAPTSGGGYKIGSQTTTHYCGSGDSKIYTSINFGCKGEGNAIVDMLFAIIRVLSNGVGLVLIGSLIYGGIQYTGSRGDPQSTAMAVNRIRSVVLALIIFIFGYAMLNYLIPGAFFN